jgi:hypothetical protein
VFERPNLDFSIRGSASRESGSEIGADSNRLTEQEAVKM